MENHTEVATMVNPAGPPPRPTPAEPTGYGIEYIAGHSNIFPRVNRLPGKGDVVHGHKHNFDHLMLVWRGAVRVTQIREDGSRLHRELYAPGPEHPDAYPDWLLIKAGVEHEIAALSDGVEFWCLYGHRDPQGRVQCEYTGWEPAYC